MRPLPTLPNPSGCAPRLEASPLALSPEAGACDAHHDVEGHGSPESWMEIPSGALGGAASSQGASQVHGRRRRLQPGSRPLGRGTRQSYVLLAWWGCGRGSQASWPRERRRSGPTSIGCCSARIGIVYSGLFCLGAPRRPAPLLKSIPWINHFHKSPDRDWFERCIGLASTGPPQYHGSTIFEDALPQVVSVFF